MNSALKSFKLGEYKGFKIEAHDDTELINTIMQKIIESSTYEFDDEIVAKEADRIAKELEEKLEADKKPLRLFMYLNQIPEGGFVDYCATEYAGGLIEDSIILSIAKEENIEVTSEDIAEVRINFADEYSRAVMEGMGPDEAELKRALLAKKVLSYLVSANTWTNEQEMKPKEEPKTEEENDEK